MVREVWRPPRVSMDQQSAQDRVVAATHETFYAQLVNEALASLHLHVPCLYFILSFVLVLKNGSGQELSPLHPGRIFFFLERVLETHPHLDHHQHPAPPIVSRQRSSL